MALEGHSGAVTALTFSDDGKQVISASDGGTVRFWDTTTGSCRQTAEIGMTIYELSCRFGLLTTDVGIFDIGNAQGLVKAKPASISDELASQLEQEESSRQLGYGLNSDSSWITWKGHNMLWLPSEYRPSASAIFGGSVVLGCASGHVLIFEFDAKFRL